MGVGELGGEGISAVVITHWNHWLLLSNMRKIRKHVDKERGEKEMLTQKSSIWTFVEKGNCGFCNSRNSKFGPISNFTAFHMFPFPATRGSNLAM